MNRIVVTIAESQDIDAVAILFDLYRQFYRQAPDLEGARTFLRDRLESGESVVLLASSEDRPRDSGAHWLGFAQLYPLFSSVRMIPVMVLNDLYVSEAARRSGVGRALLQASVEYARTAGAGLIQLETEVGNDTAKALYESDGWKLDSSCSHYVLEL